MNAPRKVFTAEGITQKFDAPVFGAAEAGKLATIYANESKILTKILMCQYSPGEIVVTFHFANGRRCSKTILVNTDDVFTYGISAADDSSVEIIEFYIKSSSGEDVLRLANIKSAEEIQKAVEA